jgi:hypothetical protein
MECARAADTAARLLGAVEALQERLGARTGPTDHGEFDRNVSACRRRARSSRASPRERSAGWRVYSAMRTLARVRCSNSRR